MKQSLAVTFVLITLVIDAMGIGLILPVMPSLIREVEGGDLGQAAVWGGILSTSFAVMQFTFGPILGGLSDRFGRRPVLILSLFVMVIDYLVLAVAGSIWLILVIQVINGITSATMATCNAFIADISKPEQRAARFGLVGAAFGLGFILGPIIGGLLSEFGTRAPFFAAAGLTALNLALGFFVLPETVTDAIRRPFRWSRANPFGAFRDIGRLPGIRPLLAIVLVYEFAFIVYPATWAYFTAERFGWSEKMVGLSLGLFGISMMIVQGGLIRIILKRLGERGTVAYGLIFNTMAFAVLALLTNPTLALIFTPITALGAVVTPALQGMMSNAVSQDRQGALQGVVSSAKSIAAIAAPLTMTQLFFLFTREGAPLYLPGAPFALSMALMVVCGVIFVAGLREARPADP